jgi:hypothetical protein
MTGSAEHSAAENGDKHLDDEVRGCTRAVDRDVFATGNCLPVLSRLPPVSFYRLLLLLLLFNTTRTFRTPKHEVWTAVHCVQFTNSRKESFG